jgi:hypothetical protein
MDFRTAVCGWADPEEDVSRGDHESNRRGNARDCKEVAMGHRTWTLHSVLLICLCTLALILLRAGDVGAWNAADWYKLTDTNYCPNCQLDNCDCGQLNLQGANLAGAHLHGANLYGTNLHGANLRGADLSGAEMRDTNLSGADVSGANLQGAHLGGATWTDGSRCDVNWPGCCHAEDRGDNHRCCIKGTKCQ